MKRILYIHLLIFISVSLFSQTTDIILGKRFQNVEFGSTTYRQIKKNFCGQKRRVDKSTSYITTVVKCYKVNYLTVNYVDLGLTFKFKKGGKNKTYKLTKIVLDSLSKDYINYSIQVNKSSVNDVIEKFGNANQNEELKLLYGTNSIFFLYDNALIIRRIEINSNKIIEL